MKSKIFLFFTATVLFASCKKNDIVDQIVNPEIDITKAYKDIASIVITTAKNNDNFRTIAYTECNKQKFGDYYVKLNELIALNAIHNYWDEATVIKLSNLEKAITEQNVIM